MTLCLTTGPLLHGVSAAIVQILMLIFSHRVLNSWLFSGEPNTEVHISIKFFTITSLCLLLITRDAINLVRWSIKRRNHVLEAHSLKSSATVSLKQFTWKKLTVDLGLSFLYLKHISQLWLISHWLFVLIHYHQHWHPSVKIQVLTQLDDWILYLVLKQYFIFYFYPHF